METSLHQQLKEAYAGEDAEMEVRLGQFRIDVVCGEELIEIQHGSLGAIRDKVRKLLKKHRVRVVKPIISRKRLVKRAARGRRVIDRRMSPKRGSILNLFEDLVYFRKVFPHPNLILEVPLVFVEEWRFPGHGRRRWRREKDHQVEDQKLVEIDDVHQFQTEQDLVDLVPDDLPAPFDTGHLATSMNIHRSSARQIAYCLRETGAIRMVGKTGNALLYEFN